MFYEINENYIDLSEILIIGKPYFYSPPRGKGYYYFEIIFKSGVKYEITANNENYLKELRNKMIKEIKEFQQIEQDYIGGRDVRK